MGPSLTGTAGTAEGLVASSDGDGDLGGRWCGGPHAPARR
ncbi:hypothetical protein BJY28_000078 [Janibacter alkaliphilus]|uniref:Uncharacterized protein n=1 Tax=Janibacter alkaliphilus TaxID=1069963 RepID=A0A852WYC7_9MICO|nr:hypothetical protein [Janibacter alkaliphilus]